MRNFRLDDESGHQEALFEWAAYHMDCMPGDILEMAEYTNGEETGRIIKAEVTYMLQEYAGLAEGYCIMAIKVMGIVSETDTKGVKHDRG